MFTDTDSVLKPIPAPLIDTCNKTTTDVKIAKKQLILNFQIRTNKLDNYLLGALSFGKQAELHCDHTASQACQTVQRELGPHEEKHHIKGEEHCAKDQACRDKKKELEWNAEVKEGAG